MSTSLFLAQLIGPVAIAGALGLLADRNGFRAMAEQVIATQGLMFISGLLTMTAGLAIVLNHNLWTTDWRVLLTVFGWAATIGGAARIVVPRQVGSVGTSMLRFPLIAPAGGLIWLTFGGLLCFFGYVR